MKFVLKIVIFFSGVFLETKSSVLLCVLLVYGSSSVRPILEIYFSGSSSTSCGRALSSIFLSYSINYLEKILR